MLRRAVGGMLPVAVAAAVAVGVVAGVATARTRHAAAAKVTYKLSAHVAGVRKNIRPHVTAAFSGTLTAKGTHGVLRWKLTSKPALMERHAVIQAGKTVRLRSGKAFNKVLAHLCAPCAAKAHGTTRLAGAALKSIAGGKSSILVSTRFATLLHGSLRSTPTTKTAVGVKPKPKPKKKPPTTTTPSLTITPTAALVAKGKKVVAANGCGACHSINGTAGTGPTWKGLYGSTVQLASGGTTKATASYLVGVITQPSSLDVAGFDPTVMSEVIPDGDISQTEAKAVVAYIMTLK